IAVVLLSALVSLLYYRRFRYRLEDDVLIVQQAVFERRELKVQADRVQHMAMEQPVYMRPFGVVRFSLDTPGGITTEVELPGIPQSTAETLRAQLDTARRRSTINDPEQAPPAGTGEPLHRTGAAGLTLHGIASNHAYVIAAALTPFLQPLERALRPALQQLETFHDLAASPALVIGLTLACLLATMLVLSVAVSWLRYYDFRLFRDDGRFLQRSGLFNRQEQSLSAAKLQSVEWVQTAVGRMVGRGYLICRQYGGQSRGPDHAGGKFVIPGLTVESSIQLGQLFWLTREAQRSDVPAYAATPFRRVSRLYRRVTVLRVTLAGILACAVLAAYTQQPAWLGVILPIGLLSLPVAHLRWLTVGWKREGRFVHIRIGLLGRRTALFPLEHVQGVTVRESWFQRRHGLATLQLQLASGPVALPFIDRAQALALANEALYLVEGQVAATPILSTD
ncbi:MAG: PH domain-containing protein, partial [Ectothiorhodospiraceae bacterium]|nr:PH domain-containing protein [Ectothiorhodospiraceae bacterium]